MGESTGFWTELRRDPKHVSEIAVRHAQPLLAPHVTHWWSRQRRARPSEDPERTAKRVLRRSTQVARRGGLVTGSSFYVGMLPAVVMIYCEQVVLVLRIAAAFGREPADPVRAAEFLYLQGRYPSVEDAASALAAAGQPSDSRDRSHGLAGAVQIVRQAPSMISLRLSRFRERALLDKVIGAVEIASYFVPVVSMPIWAYANARASRRLGRAAIEFYNQPSTEPRHLPDLVMPPRPAPRTRKVLIGTVVPLALAMGVLFSLLPFGRAQQGLRWIGLALGEAVVALTFARLVRLTRVPKSGPGGQGADSP